LNPTLHRHYCQQARNLTEPLEEAYELVEEGVVTEADFRDFVVINPVTLWTGMNPEFFKGTVVEQDGDKLRNPETISQKEGRS
jgi:hypothetical protein